MPNHSLDILKWCTIVVHEKINVVDPYRTATHCVKYTALYENFDDIRDPFNYSTSVKKTSDIILSETIVQK